MITAMVYPLMLLLLSMLITAFMLIYVTPKIISMFESLHQVLPLPTRILIAASNIFQSYWWVFILLAVVAVVAVRQIRRSTAGRRSFDNMSLKLPLFGQLVRKVAVNRFAQTLGSLLENGVSMMPALGICREHRRQCTDSRSSVRRCS